MPCKRAMSAIRRTVVVLPLVPVTATTGTAGRWGVIASPGGVAAITPAQLSITVINEAGSVSMASRSVSSASATALMRPVVASGATSMT